MGCEAHWRCLSVLLSTRDDSGPKPSPGIGKARAPPHRLEAQHYQYYAGAVVNSMRCVLETACLGVENAAGLRWLAKAHRPAMF